MKYLYLISQDVNNGYDTIDAAVVCAENAEQARNIMPYKNDIEGIFWPSNKEHVNVKLIGIANDFVPIGQVLSSYNAG